MASSRPTDAEIAQAMRESGWTELRTSVVAQLYNSGLSAAKCASLIGGVTRNAVIGKIDRSNLSIGDARPLPTYSNLKCKGQPKPRKPQPIKTVSPEHVARKEAPPIVDVAIPVEQRRRLVDLNANCCRWPVGDPGDPEFFFCGGVIEPNAPYCPAHMRRAHDRVREPRLKPTDRRLHKVSRYALI